MATTTKAAELAARFHAAAEAEALTKRYIVKTTPTPIWTVAEAPAERPGYLIGNLAGEIVYVRADLIADTREAAAEAFANLIHEG